MVKNKNIFDLINTDDLPRSLRNKKTRSWLGKDTKRILELFSRCSTLSCDMIRVGYYRVHKAQLKSHILTHSLYTLQRKKIIKKINYGIYHLIKMPKEYL